MAFLKMVVTKITLSPLKTKNRQILICRSLFLGLSIMVTLGHQQAMWAKPHNFIHLTFSNSDNYREKVAELYQQGLSLLDIAKRIDLPKTKVRDLVLRSRIPLRTFRNEKSESTFGNSGKRNAKPPYGFAYFEGRVVKHPKEYPILLSIISQWKSGRPLNSIATKLNEKRVPSPMGKTWSWNSIANIIQRIKTGQLIQNGDQYDLR